MYVLDLSCKRGKKIIRAALDGSMHRLPNLCMFLVNVSLLRSETLLAFSFSILEYLSRVRSQP